MIEVRVRSNDRVAKDWHLLQLEGAVLEIPVPGQFVHLRVSSTTDPLLRRPFSVHFYRPEQGVLSLLLQVKGKGTRMLKKLKTADTVNILGPLGTGFTPASRGKVLLLGGGIGVAPLYYLGCQIVSLGGEPELVVGGASSEYLPGEEFFHSTVMKLAWVTEDGSRGYHGTVVDYLKSYPGAGHGIEMIYACGPPAMLERVVEEASLRGIPVQVSLEATFACGIGACLGCVHPVKTPEGVSYLRVCKEGPVFNGEDVVFNV